jgi:hypothetical protein
MFLQIGVVLFEESVCSLFEFRIRDLCLFSLRFGSGSEAVDEIPTPLPKMYTAISIDSSFQSQNIQCRHSKKQTLPNYKL